MTLKPLHAGDGYVYLTRQVASGDVTRRSGDPLVDYYQAIGNPPGRWVGSGCRDLGVSGEVSEEQMLALFGEGLHPNANELIAERIAAGDSFDQALKTARLGRKFYQYDHGVPLLADIREAYTAFAQAHRRRATVEERRDIKESVARARWVAEHPNEPPPNDEQVRRYLVDQLGRSRQPVAGFDLVFSMIKSGKILWALGGPRIRRIVEEIHEDALRGALAYGEREAGFTRVGANGVAYKRVSGFVATAFEHRDSRAGDPDLHTHVAISNRVLADDGVWRTIDSRQLHKVAVSMSETYNTLIERGFTERLGVRWVEIDHGPGKRPVREIDGIPVEWIRGFSRRRTQVEAGYEQLVAEYVRLHGHTPPRSVQYQLAQQATLENRPAKTELRTLAEQIEDWTRHAHDLLPGMDIPARIQACLHRGEAAEAIVGPDLEQVAASVVARIAEERATWAVYHVRAEAHRQLRPHAAFFASRRELLQVVETVTRTALDRRSILLDVEVEDLPRLLRHHDTPRVDHDDARGDRDTDRDDDRADSRDHLDPSLEVYLDDYLPDDVAGSTERDVGAEESVFRRRGSRIYTSEAILAAERRLVDDARAARGAVVPDEVRDAAILRWQQDTGKTLNAGQRALVAHFVSSGNAVAVGIGPPGTGKSTTMAAMRAVWETTGGRVIGYAPSAAAASVLSDDLGVRADTLHSLIVARRNRAAVDVKPGDLLLVDEAGMAGTLILDEVRALAAERGAVVRLLGDYRQLTAVEAGGALRLIHHDVGGVSLHEMHRFTRPDEANAVLQFRVGDQAAVDWYVDNDRVIGGVGPAVLDRLYRNWKSDVDAGRVAIMISDSNHVARELSARAQTERRVAGLVEHDGVRLHDGTVAGVGDRVVTRLNRRNLTLFGGADFVKNGDLWEVTERHEDGRLTVRHLKHGGEVRLSAAYVARFVELGYAATIHRSQGMTVDICRAFLSAMAVREAALVALSRGRDANYAYLDTEQVLSVDENPILPGDLFYRHREMSLAEQALRAILNREGAELSATEQLRNTLDGPHRLSILVPQYGYARQLHRGPAGMQEAEDWVRAALPRYTDEILADEAWPELARVLHEVRDTGAEPVALLRRRAAQRALTEDPLDPAESVAQVLHWRITQDMPTPGTGPHPDRPDLLPGWIPTPPRPNDDLRIPGNLADIVELGTWLRRRAEQIAARVHQLGERLARQVTHHTAQNAAHGPSGHDRRHGTGTAPGQQNEHEPDQAGQAMPAPPAWVAHLGPVPDDPVVREQWIRRAGHVAAYRERWHIPDTQPDLLPDSRAEQGRARTWVLAYLRDHPLHHAARDATQRAAHDRDTWDQHAALAAERARHHQRTEQERKRRRAEMAALLQDTWRHEPGLVDIILTATAFDTVASRLAEAAEAGYDLREVLAEIPLDAVGAAHIADPAAYTAAMVDVAVDRIRTGQADRDAHNRAEQQRYEQMRDQVIDLLREAWEQRPHLAEAVIHAPTFTTLVRTLDQYADAGLAARDLLTAIPLGKLDAPNIVHKDRFAVYLTHRAAHRQLHALDQARRIAHEQAERVAVQRGAAAVLRHAWHHHPDHAQQVIDGPAFRFLAERMLTAHQQGHDVDAILRGLDPVALTAAHVPSPSGATTAAFTRALQRRAQPPTAHPTPPDASTPPQIGVDPTAVPVRLAAARQPEPSSADDQQSANLEHFTQRPHGRRTDPDLQTRIRSAQREADRLANHHQRAREHADQLRQAAEAGAGRHVRALDNDLAQLRDQAALVRRADELEHQWRETTERARQAAEQRAHARHDLDRLGRLARTRRTELTQRITHLSQVEERAQHEAAELAHRAAVLHQQTGPKEQRQRIHDRTQRLETDYPNARQIALSRDRAAAEHAEHTADQLLNRHHQRTHELDQLRAEQQLRDRLPDTARELENSERLAAQATPPAADQHPTEPALRTIQPTTPQPSQPETVTTEITGNDPATPQHTPAVEPDIEPPAEPQLDQPEP